MFSDEGVTVGCIGALTHFQDKQKWLLLETYSEAVCQVSANGDSSLLLCGAYPPTPASALPTVL